MHEHTVRQAQLGAIEHGGPEQTVEVNDVLTNKVVQLGGGILVPKLIKIYAVVIAIVLKTRHITNGCIQPHIKVFAWLIWNFKTKVGRFTADVPRLQTLFNPFV